MIVELCPSPEHTINLRVQMEVNVLCLHTMQKSFQQTIRCVDPGAHARTRLVAAPAVNTYEWQLQLENTALAPESLLERVRERALASAHKDEDALARGKSRNPRTAWSPMPPLRPRLF